MDDELKWIADVEAGKMPLAELMRAIPSFADTIQKRRRGHKIALITMAAAGAVFALIGLVALRGSSRDTISIMLVIILAVVAIYIAMLLIMRFAFIAAPRKRLSKALSKGYPGLDASTEAGIRSYVWTYADEPRALLDNICQLILADGSERRHAGGNTYNIYTPTESVVLHVWKTNDIDYEIADFAENPDGEIGYLRRASESFRAIGAAGEAAVWDELRELMSEIIDGIEDDEEDFYFDPESMLTEEQETRLEGLRRRLGECRDDSIAKLHAFVMQRKALFSF